MTETTTPDAAGFRGWPADALAFLAELEQDNSRAFWTENADRYRTAVLAPTRALAAALADEFGALRVFRPYVDRRLRPQVDPYRTDTGATVTRPGGTHYAVVLSTRGLAVQVGHRRFDRGQLRRYRAAVDDAAGEELVALLAAVADDGLVPDDVASLAGRPRGCPRDHARLPLMRLRGLHVDRAWAAGDWLGTDEAVPRVRAAWRAARPLADWLDEHVGRRTEPSARARLAASARRDGDAGPRSTADHGPTHSARPDEVDTLCSGGETSSPDDGAAARSPRPDQEHR